MAWITKKIRGGFTCLKENGFVYTVKLSCKKVVQKILSSEMLKIFSLFKNDILSGYNIYKNCVDHFGSDTTIFGCAFSGTGDYYICGLYIDAWLKANNNPKFKFLCKKGGNKKILTLFPSMIGHIEEFEAADYERLRIMRSFIAQDKINFIFLHHHIPFPKNKSRVVSGWNLMGYNGLEMVDFYLSFGFKLPRTAPKNLPVFSNDKDKIREEYFRKNNLTIGKTVLLAPYSTGLKQFLLPENFWKNIAKNLQLKGYSVCCNCADGEKAIEETVPIFIPYQDIVPFLNMCSTKNNTNTYVGGGAIGIRSGLFDIISTANCKKIIVHTYKAKWWPNGKSIAYTGLNNMGLCNDAIELEYKTEQDCAELQEEILKQF